jgi:hypothetical protein
MTPQLESLGFDNRNIRWAWIGVRGVQGVAGVQERGLTLLFTNPRARRLIRQPPDYNLRSAPRRSAIRYLLFAKRCPFGALDACSRQAFYLLPFASVASFARGLFRLEQTIAQLAPEMFRSLGISGNERQIDFVILSCGKDQAGSLRSIGDSAYHQRILRKIFSESQAAFGEHPFFNPFG